MARAHEGPGLGSTFIVRLPVKAGEKVFLGESPSGHEPARLGIHRILVVDDSPDAADSLALLLRILRAEVLTARDGESALSAFTTFHPTVALLDIGMPGMDGYEVTRQARLLPGGTDIMVIALTGWGQEEDRPRSRQAGIDHHLVKPVDLRVLETLIAANPVSTRR